MQRFENDGDPAPKKTQKGNCVHWMTILGGLTFCIVSMVLTQQGGDASSSDLDIATDVTDNWKLGSLTDIKLVPDNLGCPEGYTNLISREWMGTDAGCDCENTLTFDFRGFNGVRHGTCTKD